MEQGSAAASVLRILAWVILIMGIIVSGKFILDMFNPAPSIVSTGLNTLYLEIAFASLMIGASVWALFTAVATITEDVIENAALRRTQNSSYDEEYRPNRAVRRVR